MEISLIEQLEGLRMVDLEAISELKDPQVDVIDDCINRDAIHRKLERLTVAQRWFILLVMYGYKQCEIARLFWVTEAYVSCQLSKAKKKMKE